MKLLIAILVLALAGAGFITTGVFLLAGPGWAFIAGGVFALAAAVICRNGLNPNG
ncbi:hypothetical protein [Bosea sp. WAO]|uniref:hypothetical protein n=1 Tax=Bosea sp. WAO TaxID=406341 RepID=UPI000A923258|nr:hypothetical protein [Bosea sp. WAO]